MVAHVVIVSAQVQSFGFGFIWTWIGLGLGLDKKNLPLPHRQEAPSHARCVARVSTFQGLYSASDETRSSSA